MVNYSLKQRLFRTRDWKKEIFHWILLLVGAFFIAAGFALFTNPYKIIPGGVYGLGRIFHHLIPAIPTGTFGLMMDVPLIITAFIVFGKGFGSKTIISAVTTPLFMNMITKYIGEDPTDGVCLLSQYLNFSDNVLMAAIYGGLLIGLGIGLTLRTGATSGGTDIVSMLVVKFAHIKFSTAMIIIESTIILVGMFVLGDWKLPLYSLIAIFVSTKMIDFTLEGANSDKALFILTDKQEQLRKYILYDLDRGATIIKAMGAYTRADKEMIFVVVSRRQVTPMKEMIHKLDPHAFVVMVDASETIGDGFKTFEQY